MTTQDHREKYREAFEKWAHQISVSTDKDDARAYFYADTEDMWSAWCAAMRYRDELEKDNG